MTHLITINADQHIRPLKERLLQRDDDALQILRRSISNVLCNLVHVACIECCVNLIEDEERRVLIRMNCKEKSKCCNRLLTAWELIHVTETFLWRHGIVSDEVRWLTLTRRGDWRTWHHHWMAPPCSRVRDMQFLLECLHSVECERLQNDKKNKVVYLCEVLVDLIDGIRDVVEALHEAIHALLLQCVEFRLRSLCHLAHFLLMSCKNAINK